VNILSEHKSTLYSGGSDDLIRSFFIEDGNLIENKEGLIDVNTLSDFGDVSPGITSLDFKQD